MAGATFSVGFFPGVVGTTAGAVGVGRSAGAVVGVDGRVGGIAVAGRPGEAAGSIVVESYQRRQRPAEEGIAVVVGDYRGSLIFRWVLRWVSGGVLDE